MIISNAHRFIYLRPPAAHGAAVADALSPYLSFRDVALGGRYGAEYEAAYAQAHELTTHSNAGAVLAVAGLDVWRSFFVFSFTRDPYARAYAVWRENLEESAEDLSGYEAFVCGDDFTLGRIPRALPQAHWLAGRDARLAPGIDFVGRIESFGDDIGFVRTVLERTPYPAETGAPPTEPDWRAALTPDAQSAIEATYAADFQLFGYKFLSDRAEA